MADEVEDMLQGADDEEDSLLVVDEVDVGGTAV